MKEHEGKPSASQQLADELADSAVAEHHMMRAQRVAVPSTITRRRVVQVALTVAVPILFAVLLATFAWQPLMSFLEPASPPAIASQQAQEMLDALVGEIDSFRNDYDELPATLVDIGVPPRGQWSYVVSGHAQFTVQGTLNGQVVSFDSASAAARPNQERP